MSIADLVVAHYLGGGGGAMQTFVQTKVEPTGIMQSNSVVDQELWGGEGVTWAVLPSP